MGFSSLSSAERGREKIEAVICWLARFGFSDRKVLANLLDVTKAGNSAFFRRLASSSFIRTHEMPDIAYVGRPRILYSLTDSGYGYASMLLPDLEIKRKPALPTWITQVHSLAIQRDLIRQERDGLCASYVSEIELSRMTLAHSPDAILTRVDGSREALEIELTQKSESRIYHIFLGHVRNIGEGAYRHVRYIFRSPGLRKKYESLYLREVWPIYKVNSRTRKIELDGMNTFVSASVRSAGVFKFDLGDFSDE